MNVVSRLTLSTAPQSANDAARKAEVDAKYTKPASGIPKSDLTSSLQTSIDKADSGYQKPTSGIPAADMAAAVQTIFTDAAAHIAIVTGNPHAVTLQDAATKQGATAVILPTGLNIYAGSIATGNKLATVSEATGGGSVSFTTAQQEAIDSGITSAKVTSYDGHIADAAIHMPVSWGSDL